MVKIVVVYDLNHNSAITFYKMDREVNFNGEKMNVVRGDLEK